jgi:hypothetical protein
MKSLGESKGGEKSEKKFVGVGESKGGGKSEKKLCVERGNSKRGIVISRGNRDLYSFLLFP